MTLTLKYLNDIIERTAGTRLKIVKRFVSDTARAIKQHFLIYDQGVAADGLKNTMRSMATALTTIIQRPTDGTATPNGILEEIQTVLTSAGTPNILSEESIATMTHQVKVTELLKILGSAELGKLPRSEVLRPLENVTAYLNQAIDWFNFLDQLQEQLSTYKFPHFTRSHNDSTAKANYVDRKYILPALEEFSTLLGLETPPRDSMNPADFAPFRSRLNEILYHAWNQRKDHIMTLLDELSHEMIALFRSKTSCGENAIADREKIAKFIEFIDNNELSLGSNLTGKQFSPTQLVAFYEDILSPLRSTSPTFGAAFLKEIKDQQDFFQVLQWITPRLADVGMTRALRRLQPAKNYLRQVESWLDLLYDLQVSLLGHGSPLNFTAALYSSDPHEVGLNETTWYDFVNQSATHFHLTSPPIAKDVLDQKGTACFVNALAKAAHQARVTFFAT